MILTLRPIISCYLQTSSYVSWSRTKSCWCRTSCNLFTFFYFFL